MVTENSNNSKFKVVFQGDAGTAPNWNGFTLSRSMLRVERLDVQQMSLVTITYQPNPNQSIAYYTDPDGVLEIPLRDFIDANAENTPSQLEIDINMTEMDGTAVDTFGKYIDILPGVSYQDALAPRGKDAQQLYWEHEHSVILPPNVIICPDTFDGISGIGVIVESNYHLVDTNAVWGYLIGGINATITPGGARDSELEVPYSADTLRIAAGKDNDQIKTWPLTKEDDCTNLVCCQWTSQTGAVRRHFFPIAAFIEGTDKTYSIVEAGNGYDIRKDTFNAIRVRLTGLTSYGFWYYMDILRASDLHAIVHRTFSSFNDEIASMETAAYCEAQELETPQGNGFYSLEFTIKLRHYDTH